MQLYLLRHGIAVDASDWDGTDDFRPLTEEGHERTREVIDGLKRQGKLRVGAIWSSPLTRALQTAQIAADVLDLKVEVNPELASGTNLRRILKDFKTREVPENLMLVGHEPDCGMIIGELIGDPAGDYALKRAGIALLEGKLKLGGMKLEWKLQPKDVLK
jgi:phosphohistidine phosphatase